jgi:hypothetical protein
VPSVFSLAIPAGGGVDTPYTVPSIFLFQYDGWL